MKAMEEALMVESGAQPGALNPEHMPEEHEVHSKKI
jgi:hypothetical protein